MYSVPVFGPFQLQSQLNAARTMALAINRKTLKQQAEWRQVEQAISERIGRAFQLQSAVAVGGGCINSAYRLLGAERSFLVKLNRTDRLGMFETEAAALDAIIATATVRTPQPICHGVTDAHSFLVLEWIELRSADRSAEQQLGRQLARMHRIEQSHFGWSMDNVIGATPQLNRVTSDWVDFWRSCRLGFQLELAEENGYSGRLQKDGARLCDLLDGFFTDYHPQPSLLHGDLWSGNHAMSTTGSPLIFDPACYYGDREADMAMTELFGGFGSLFYQAYQATWPLDAGYQSRKQLYNLYHILNHLNLFGSGYLAQAESMVRALLVELD